VQWHESGGHAIAMGGIKYQSTQVLEKVLLIPLFQE
jgi:hypothetical protein